MNCSSGLSQTASIHLQASTFDPFYGLLAEPHEHRDVHGFNHRMIRYSVLPEVLN